MLDYVNWMFAALFKCAIVVSGNAAKITVYQCDLKFSHPTN